jgi:hypothetical protein
MANRTVTMQNIEYEVVQFKYMKYSVESEEFIVLLENPDWSIEGKGFEIGELYIQIASWVEMQEIARMSMTKNIMTSKYELDRNEYMYNKIKVLCRKIVEADGTTHFFSDKIMENIDIDMGFFIARNVDLTIIKYYTDTGLSVEQEKELNLACYDYYAAVYKKAMGKENVSIPPAPGIVSLMGICEIFDCTPDVARKISKRDIDAIGIAKEQESICRNHPEMLGFGKGR